jgi:hypothetical protein
MRATFSATASRLRKSPGYLLIAGILVCLAAVAIAQREPPVPAHTCQPGSHRLEDQWVIHDIELYLEAPVADEHAIYVSRYDQGLYRLAAIDADTGEDLWEQDEASAWEHRGVRSLLLADDSLYATYTTELVAFDAPTGRELWATELGTGHVRVIPSLLGGEIVVYYGDSLIRVPRSTGRPADTQPLGSLLWTLPQIEIRRVATGVMGMSRTTGEAMWTSSQTAFTLREDQPPAVVSPSELLVPVSSSLCIINLESGIYSRCFEGPFASNAAIGPIPGRAFVLDDEFNLLSLDLEAGAIEVAAQFPGGIRPADTGRGYSYFVTASPSRLFVYFGDSHQMFAGVVE